VRPGSTIKSLNRGADRFVMQSAQNEKQCSDVRGKQRIISPFAIAASSFRVIAMETGSGTINDKFTTGTQQ